jgi:hypothetical protein
VRNNAETDEFENDMILSHRAQIVHSSLRVVLWPRELGKAIATGSQSFPIPPNEVSSKERVSTSGFEASKILWSIAWLLLNIFVAYPLANFLGWWWVIIMPFESLIEARKSIVCVLDIVVSVGSLTTVNNFV